MASCPHRLARGVSERARILCLHVTSRTVGYLVATVVFITIESRLLGSRAWFRDLIVSVFITASVYGVFNLLLRIRLPAGLIG